MKRLLVALFVTLIPALASGQVVSGSPFGGGSGAAASVASVFGNRMVVCPVKTLSNTSATVQPIATVTTTTATGGSAMMYFTTLASNGAVVNSESGLVNVGWNNAAGTVAGAITGIVVNAGSDGSGTLTSVPTVTVATNVVTINTTPTWTTIVPTLVTSQLIFFVSGIDSVVCL